MRKKLYTEGLALCCILLASSSIFTLQPGEVKNINVHSTSGNYKLKMHGKKLDYKCSGPYPVPIIRVCSMLILFKA